MENKKDRDLTFAEHIRKRPGMYIGRVDQNAFTNALKLVLVDLIFELRPRAILLNILNEFDAKIYIQKPSFGFNELWCKSYPKSNSFSPGLIPVFSALCEASKLELIDENDVAFFEYQYRKGEGKEAFLKDRIHTFDNLRFNFSIDREVWGTNFKIDANYLTHHFREFAFLNSEIFFEVKFEIENEQNRSIFKFKNGLLDKLKMISSGASGSLVFPTRMLFEKDNLKIEAAFAFREYSVDEPILKSYANFEYTPENGTHTDALVRGITFGIMKYFQKHELTNQYKISKKRVAESLVAVVHLQYENTAFEGCVKHKVGNPEIIKPISDFVADLIFQKLENDNENMELVVRNFRI